ncbi:MAG: metallophosphoesterase [Ignavibacteriae bacterium]|nr:metallophosphoesterase [Ignavibacteriota bacterium]
MNKNKTIAIIGDIHGCYEEFQDLYNSILNYTDKVYTVGDLIDRGPDTKKVIQFCIENNIKSVRGNHEEMLLRAINKPRYKEYQGYDTNLENWRYNGGNRTIKSYLGDSSKKFKSFVKEFKDCCHYDFITNLPLKIETDNCIITHGGIVNNAHFENVLWNREIPSKLNKLQIFGHTANRNVLYKPNHYINVDTGCVFWGTISAAIVSGKKEVNIIKSKEYEEYKYKEEHIKNISAY